MSIYIYTALFGLYILGAAYFEGKLKEWIELSIRVDSEFRNQYGEEYGKFSGVVASLLWGPITIVAILWGVWKLVSGCFKK